MIFMLHCRVDPSQAHRLTEFREEHVAHAKAAAVKILGAGPTMSDDATQIIGGLFVIEAQNREQAQAFYDTDPYVREKIWKSTLFERYDKRV